MVEIVRETIDVNRVLRSVHDNAAGGTAVFVGTARDHSDGKNVLAIEYQAYPPMAEKMMHAIVDEVLAQWRICNISIVHRIGRLEIGEASVVIAVSSEHRKEAFEACRYAVDTMKKSVPLWKKEVFEDSEVWVGSKERRPPV